MTRGSYILHHSVLRLLEINVTIFRFCWTFYTATRVQVISREASSSPFTCACELRKASRDKMEKWRAEGKTGWWDARYMQFSQNDPSEMGTRDESRDAQRSGAEWKIIIALRRRLRDADMNFVWILSAMPRLRPARATPSCTRYPCIQLRFFVRRSLPSAAPPRLSTRAVPLYRELSRFSILHAAEKLRGFTCTVEHVENTRQCLVSFACIERRSGWTD